MESKLSGHSHDTAIMHVSGPNSRCLKNAESEQALRLLSCRCKPSYDHHPERDHRRMIHELYTHLVTSALREWFVSYRFIEGIYIAIYIAMF